MERIILESIFLSTVIFLVLFYIKLFRKVIYFRGKEKIALGGGDAEQLIRAMRAHSNFNENVPLGLVLSMFLYFLQLHLNKICFFWTCIRNKQNHSIPFVYFPTNLSNKLSKIFPE